jgi:hypothetical protein
MYSTISPFNPTEVFTIYAYQYCLSLLVPQNVSCQLSSFKTSTYGMPCQHPCAPRLPPFSVSENNLIYLPFFKDQLVTEQSAISSIVLYGFSSNCLVYFY